MQGKTFLQNWKDTNVLQVVAVFVYEFLQSSSVDAASDKELLDTGRGPLFLQLCSTKTKAASDYATKLNWLL